VLEEMENPAPYPVAFQNVPFTPPNNSPWVNCSVTFGDSAYATILGPSTGYNRYSGVVILDIFSPIGIGSGDNYDIGGRLKQVFDRQAFGNIVFDAASGPAQVQPATPESFFQTRLSISFQAHLE